MNFETVKYFNNEEFEARRYDENLKNYRLATLKSQRTLSLLNTGQQLIIATGLVAMLWRATQGAVSGHMTLGDLVMVNAFMIQLYIPLGILGALYREMKQSLAAPWQTAATKVSPNSCLTIHLHVNGSASALDVRRRAWNPGHYI